MTTTATILFGHIEDEIYICEHLEIIKNIQRETGGITAFEPLVFMPQNTDLARSAKIRQPIAPERILQMFAVSRIFFSRLIKNISVDWTKTGFDTAVRALKCGANDLGALTYDPFEIRLPEINGKGGMTPATMRAAITKAGHAPAERDPHNNRVQAPPAVRKEELVFA